MERFDFDTVIDRKNTACLKYDFAGEYGVPEDTLPFWIADMDFKVADCITDALRDRVEHGIYGYSDTGISYFRALAGWEKKHFNWDIRPKWLIKTPGVVPAINIAVKALTEENDAVLINQPVYYPFYTAITQNNRKLINSPLILEDGHYEIDFADLEEKIKTHKVKAAILCSPHNPVGRVWTKEELHAYAEICRKYNVTVICDEIHADFVFKGHKHIPFASVSKDAADRSITCTAPSKTFNIAGLQTSNILIPNESIRNKFKAVLDSFGYERPNVMGIIAAEAAYRGGEEWLAAVWEYIENNLAFTKKFLADKLPKMKLIEPEGTYLLWIDCNAYDITDKELENKLLYDAKLWLDMGSMFGPEGNKFFRFNIACPKSVLEKGLDRLAEAFKKCLTSVDWHFVFLFLLQLQYSLKLRIFPKESKVILHRSRGNDILSSKDDRFLQVIQCLLPVLFIREIRGNSIVRPCILRICFQDFLKMHDRRIIMPA